MKNVIGLDISIGATGYCIMSEKREVVDCGVIKTIPKDYTSDIHRFDDISTEVFARVGDHGVDVVFLENYAYAAPGNTHRIAELTGILKHVFYTTCGLDVGRDVFVIAPSTLKKYVLGSGVGDKGLILKYILTKWGVDIDENNTGDAYVLARIGLDFLSYMNDDNFVCENKYEDECIKAVAKQNGIFLNKRKITYKRKNS